MCYAEPRSARLQSPHDQEAEQSHVFAVDLNEYRISGPTLRASVPSREISGGGSAARPNPAVPRPARHVIRRQVLQIDPVFRAIGGKFHGS